VAQTRLRSGFCIDACALIDLDPYFREIFPTLWEDMGALVRDGLLVSPIEVYREIGREYDGDVQRWTKEHMAMFIELDEDQIKEVKAIEKRFDDLIDPDKTIPDADPFLIALAKSRDKWTVVTSEKLSTNLKPKIPDVCKALDIPCVDLRNFFMQANLKY
jgi:hypothetical protein